MWVIAIKKKEKGQSEFEDRYPYMCMYLTGIVNEK